MAKLTVQGPDVSMETKEDETILEALYRNGYAFKVGCRRGGCAICKVDLVEGEVEYNRPIAEKVLSEEEKADGTCLSCRAVPVTDVAIVIRDGSFKRVWGLWS